MKKFIINSETFWHLVCFIILTFFTSQTSISSDKKQKTYLKVENFFESLKSMEANFIQVSPSGSVSDGKVYLDLPGKLRIEYKKPSNLLITCKGFWIVIQNRKLKTTNNIPLKQTPFSILLENKINYKNENLKLDITTASGIVSLKIIIANNPKAGELVLEFSDNPFILKKWIVKNVLGEETTVLIQNAVYNQNLSSKIFFPDNFPEPEN